MQIIVSQYKGKTGLARRNKSLHFKKKEKEAGSAFNTHLSLIVIAKGLVPPKLSWSLKTWPEHRMILSLIYSIGTTYWSIVYTRNYFG